MLALPRGGVPVACEISKALQIPLDIFLIRKFSLPGSPARTAGMVASGNVYTLDPPHRSGDPALEAILAREYAELARRELSYRQSRTAQLICDRCVIVVDDGLTTGFTMRSAVRALRLHHPAQIIAAIPVASAEVCADLKSVADSVVCARTPEAFSSVRRCYVDFAPVLDREIRQLLSVAAIKSAPRAFHA